MINDPKPYGVGAGRLWLESHMSKLDPKIGDPYATQVVKEIDAYVERVILHARSQAFAEATNIVDGYNDAMAIAGENGEMLPIAPFISQAIRQHSQKGRDK